MKPLWENLPLLYHEIQKSKKILLGLDYDGTLAPIARTPEQARLSTEMRSLLNDLSKNPKIILCIVTGRPLAEIKRHVRIRNMAYIANHGLQISRGTKTWTHPQAKKKAQIIRKNLLTLKKEFYSIPGILIEDKWVTLSIHYRNVKTTYRKVLQEGVQRLARNFPKEIKITHGKAVCEIRPNIDWDKGAAFLKVATRCMLPEEHIKIYIGDDLTDEDVFKILSTDDIGIRVGRRKSSCAHFYVPNIRMVHLFLGLIHALLK